MKKNQSKSNDIQAKGHLMSRRLIEKIKAQKMKKSYGKLGSDWLKMATDALEWSERRNWSQWSNSIVRQNRIKKKKWASTEANYKSRRNWPKPSWISCDLIENQRKRGEREEKRERRRKQPLRNKAKWPKSKANNNRISKWQRKAGQSLKLKSTRKNLPKGKRQQMNETDCGMRRMKFLTVQGQQH